MLTLLRNIEVYDPKPIGKKDLLLAGEKIEKILPAEQTNPNPLIDLVIDCSGLMAWPGLIDQHVHILGGGGEQGAISRAPEIGIDEIMRAGVSTVVGLLGADAGTRSLPALYAKAKSLEAQGLTTYTYSGSYALPPVTITGNVTDDLLLIDKVIGTKIAVSDHRSSQPGLGDLARVASQTHLGGLLGGKAGVLHTHIGDGKGGLGPLGELIAQTDLPAEMFVPTHVNRNPALFAEAMEFCRQGGNIDLTAGETAGIPVPEGIRRLLDAGISLEHVTVSSDSNGSIPGGGVASIRTLNEDLVGCIRAGIGIENSLRLFTENVAKLLKLSPRKGAIQPDSDADILIVDNNYMVKMLFCMGRLLFEQQQKNTSKTGAEG